MLTQSCVLQPCSSYVSPAVLVMCACVTCASKRWCFSFASAAAALSWSKRLREYAQTQLDPLVPIHVDGNNVEFAWKHVVKSQCLIECLSLHMLGRNSECNWISFEAISTDALPAPSSLFWADAIQGPELTYAAWFLSLIHI